MGHYDFYHNYKNNHYLQHHHFHHYDYNHYNINLNNNNNYKINYYNYYSQENNDNKEDNNQEAWKRGPHAWWQLGDFRFPLFLGKTLMSNSYFHYCISVCFYKYVCIM